MNDPAKISDLEVLFQRFLSLALTLAGIATFIMLIVGGFKYLTSGGDPKQVQSASQTITMAVVGLVAIIGAWFVLDLLGIITGLDLSTFSLTGVSN